MRIPSRVGTSLAAVCVCLLTPGVAQAQSLRSQQWYLDDWNINDVWSISQGTGVTVALVDTGVDITHPDLTGAVIPRAGATADHDGHGTAMASLIVGTGDGGQGVYGVAPQAKILPFYVPIIPGSNELPMAIHDAADSPAKIINISMGGLNDTQELSEAVSYALSKGKLIVAAVGDTDKTGPEIAYPARLPGVLGVNAVASDGHLSTTTVTGRGVSLSAPGQDTPTACVSASRYCMGTGSSGATALTSGIAALLWSVHPDWTADQIIRRLITTANNNPGQPNPNDDVGFGVVSPLKALTATTDPGPPNVNPLIGVRGDAPSASPPPASPQAPAPSAVTSADPPKASSSGGSSSSSTLLIVGGSVAAILVIATAAVTFTKRKRQRGYR